jgi:type I restriction enzyme, R subunit
VEAWHICALLRLRLGTYNKDSQTQARMRTAVEEVLDKTLPESYDKELFKSKRDKVYDLVYEYSRRKTKWAAWRA